MVYCCKKKTGTYLGLLDPWWDFLKKDAVNALYNYKLVDNSALHLTHTRE
jgi:hypothetical protein